MEQEWKCLSTFLSCHAHKAKPVGYPCVHLYFLPEDTYSVPMNATLVRLTVAEVQETLNDQSPLVCELLRQMHTYDCETQRIVGLVFRYPKDTSTVLSQVLRVTNDPT